jgi:hypothetical protein
MTIAMRASAAVLAALALVAAGCGGDDKKSDKTPTEALAASPAPAADAGPAFTKSALAPAKGEALEQDSPGKLIAKSDFDLTKDGFAFENYGKSTPMMRAQEIVEIFGPEVCIDPATAPACTLKPEAERWRVMQNEAAAGGHCYGFSSLALEIKRGDIPANDYGAGGIFDLRVADSGGKVINPDLDADLAREAVMQFVPGVASKFEAVTPTQLIQSLRDSWENNTHDYVLGFFQPGVGGHAVVPIAIEDMGNGKFDILLYDNNFPYIPGAPETSKRRFHVDTKTDTWNYTISVRPDVPQDQWSGNGTNNKPVLIDNRFQTRPQPCPFCGNAAPTDNGPGLGDTKKVTQIALTGDPAEHGHLRITDPDGNVTGWDGAGYVNEIPGAKIQQAFVIRRELVDPEPFYDVPAGATYKIEIVDVPDGAPEGTVHVSGPGLGVGLSRLTEGGASLTVAANGAVAVDQASAPQDVAPLLSVSVAGDREVTIVPDSDKISLKPIGGDDLKITGDVLKATAKNPETGETQKLGGGAFDLSTAVGTTS